LSIALALIARPPFGILKNVGPEYISGTCFVGVYELASSYSFDGSIHIETNFGFLLLKLMFFSGEYSET
jgi:hypothetical protein